MEKIIEQIKKPMKFVNEETGELEVKSSLCQSFWRLTFSIWRMFPVVKNKFKVSSENTCGMHWSFLRLALLTLKTFSN